MTGIQSNIDSDRKSMQFFLFHQRKPEKNQINVFGIETGLDTNARKNRSGYIMENAVAQLFRGAGIRFRQEVYSSEFPELSVLGTDAKRNLQLSAKPVARK